MNLGSRSFFVSLSQLIIRIKPLPSSPSILLLRSVPVGEIIVGASATTSNADATLAAGSEQ